MPETSVFAWTLVTCTCKHLGQTTLHLFPNAPRTIDINVLRLEKCNPQQFSHLLKDSSREHSQGCLGAKRGQTPVHAQQMKSHPQQRRCIHPPTSLCRFVQQPRHGSHLEEAECRAFSKRNVISHLPKAERTCRLGHWERLMMMMPWSACNPESSAYGYGVCSVTMRRQCASLFELLDGSRWDVTYFPLCLSG